MTPETAADAATEIAETEVLAQVKLCDIRIDPYQPRRCVPQEFRLPLAEGKTTPLEVLALITERAKSGDVEAVSYLADIRGLAQSIASDDLLYPIKCEARRNGMIVIKDGERRFWACAYLCWTEEAGPFDSLEIGVLLEYEPNATAELDESAQLKRSPFPPSSSPSVPSARPPSARREQWVVNLQRQDLPVIALADELARIQLDMQRALEANRVDTLRTYDMQDKGGGAHAMHDRGLLVELVRREMRVRTGKTMSMRMVRRCLMIANRLTPEAKALAYAMSLNYSELERVASVALSEQVATIRSIRDTSSENDDIQEDQGEAGRHAATGTPNGVEPKAAERSGQANTLASAQANTGDNQSTQPFDQRPGRSTWLEHRVTQLVAWSEQVMDTDKIRRALVKADPDTRQAYVEAAKTARDSLTRLLAVLDERTLGVAKKQR